MEQNSTLHLILIGLLGFVAINLFILDLKVFSPPIVNQVATVGTSQISTNNFSTDTSENQNSIANNHQPTTDLPAQAGNRQLITDLSCPNACLSIISEATKGSSISTVSINKNQNYTTSYAQGLTTHETYIPLGSGTTSKSDWTDITATETLINPSNYGIVKESYFVASLRNPTQNGAVEAELYNVTDKHPVWESHVILNGSTSQTITSGKISLDSGNKLYRVKLKSTLQFDAYLDNAKIRIISE